MSPFFSVVIPCWNCANFLREALASLQAQTYKNFEVLIADSESTDGTADVPQQFPELQCRVFSTPCKESIAHKRNLAAQHARAQWIAFLDADDFWTSDKLLKIKNAIETHSNKIAFCHAEYIYENDNVIGSQFYTSRALPGQDFASSLLFKGNAFSTSATVLRKDIFLQSGGFDEDITLVTAEDYDLWVRIATFGDCVFLNDVLGYYRIHGTNSSAKMQKHLNAVKAVLQKYLASIDSDYPYATARRLMRFHLRSCLDKAKTQNFAHCLSCVLPISKYSLFTALHWRPGATPCPDISKEIQAHCRPLVVHENC